MRRLLLCCAAITLWIAPAQLHAQTLADYDYENLAFRGIGFAYGRMWPDRVEPASTWTLRADLGFLGPAVRIVPNVTYWSSDLEQEQLTGLADKLSELPALRDAGVQLTAEDLGNVQWSDLSVGVDAQLVWTAPLRILGYLGAGVAIHALNGRGDAVADTFVEDLLDSTTPGLALMGGLEYQPIASFRMFGEARYSVLSDVRYPELRIGGALMLPAHVAPQGDR